MAATLENLHISAHHKLDSSQLTRLADFTRLRRLHCCFTHYMPLMPHMLPPTLSFLTLAWFNSGDADFKGHLDFALALLDAGGRVVMLVAGSPSTKVAGRSLSHGTALLLCKLATPGTSPAQCNSCLTAAMHSCLSSLANLLCSLLIWASQRLADIGSSSLSVCRLHSATSSCRQSKHIPPL